MSQSPNIVSRATPLETARLFKAQQHVNMIRYQKDWLDYTGASYEMIEDETIESQILGFLDKSKQRVAYEVFNEATGKDETKYRDEPFNPKSTDVQQVAKLLAHDCLVDAGTIEPPFFLDGGTGAHAGLNPANLISCQNGLLDITTRELYPATAMYFTRTALPVAYDPAAQCPRWREFMAEVLCNDQLVALMQKWFGLLITTDMQYQRLLYLRGRPRSGKGTTARVMDALVGPRNVTSHTIHDLAITHGRESLVGKSLLKFNDMNCDNKQDLSQAASLINSIVGVDKTHIERKFKGALEVELKMHIVMVGNQFPDFGDHAAAIGMRMNVIPFNVSFYGREDTTLDEKLRAELPGILVWALDGLDDLRWDEKFITCAASEQAKSEILNSGNPVRGFVNDECELGGFAASKDDLFDAYASYCTTIKAAPFSRDRFLTKLKTAFPALQDVRTGSDGERERVVSGIRLKRQATTITKVYKLDDDMVELLGMVCDDAIMRDASGNWIEYGSAADDFG